MQEKQLQIVFLRDYRGKASREQFYAAGATADLEESAAAYLIAQGWAAPTTVQAEAETEAETEAEAEAETEAEANPGADVDPELLPGSNPVKARRAR